MKQAKIDEYYFCKRKKLTKIAIQPSITSIGDDAFNKCSSLTQIAIPSSVTSIGWNAFSGCSSLKQITIPSSVTSIGLNAFSACSSLKQITIPSSVTEIGWNAFSGCSSLKQITIPSSVTEIGNYVFDGCSSLMQITIPSSVTSIGNYAFDGCSSLTQITIPSSVTSISNNIFNGIKILEISSDMKYISNKLFSGCSSLTQITIPSSVTKIGSYAFAKCSSLTQITIPLSVTTIGNCTFYKCTSLTKIIIPSSVTKIGSLAFLKCSSLNEVQIDASSKIDIDFISFFGCPLMKASDPLLKQYYANIDDYIINELIVTGNFAHVFKATNKNTGQKVILEAYPADCFRSNTEFIEEAVITRIPGIVKVLSLRCPLSEDEKKEVKTLEISFIYDDKEIKCDLTGYIIFTEYMKNGDISNVTKEYLKDPKSVKDKMNPTIRSKIIFGVASIMKNLHKADVLHRDLKPTKILLDENYEPKINVFHFSRFIDNQIELEMCVGTPFYMAPEKFMTNEEIYGTPSDVFSYASFLYNMFSNDHYMIMAGKGRKPQKPRNIPNNYWELIQKCWHKNPNERPTFEEIVDILKDNKFALKEFGIETDLEQLHEYQDRIDN